MTSGREGYRGGGVMGPKVGGKHTTFTRDAAAVVVALVGLSEVRRVVPGKLFGRKRSRSGLVVEHSDLPAGLRLLVRSPGGAQEVYVYTDDRASVVRALGALAEAKTTVYSHDSARQVTRAEGDKA